MGRGNIGTFGRSSVVVRSANDGGRIGSGYYLAGQRTQRAKDSTHTYNIWKRFPTNPYPSGSGTARTASAPAPAPSTAPAPAPTPGNQVPGSNDNNQGLDRLGRSGLEIPKTRESRARRRASTRGRRAQGTRRSLRISQSIGSQGSRSGVNTGD